MAAARRSEPRSPLTLIVAMVNPPRAVGSVRLFSFPAHLGFLFRECVFVG